MTRNLRTYCVPSRHSSLLVLLLAIVGLLAGCSASSRAGPSYSPRPTPTTPIRKIVGTFREFLLGPDGPSSPSNYPGHITVGPDGNLWFTESGDQECCAAIGRMTPTGTVSRFPLSYFVVVDDITTGPDGKLWFTEGPPHTY